MTPYFFRRLIFSILPLALNLISFAAFSQEIPGDLCSNALEIPVPDTSISRYGDYSNKSFEMVGCSNKESRQKVWYKFTARTSKTNLSAYSTDAFIEIFQSCDTSTRVFCKSYNFRGNDVLALDKNGEYFLRISVTASSKSNSWFNLTTIAENDNCAEGPLVQPYEISGALTQVNYANANPSVGLSNCLETWEDLWYQIQPADPWIEVGFSMSSGVSGFALYESCSNSASFVCKNYKESDTVPVFNLQKGATYRLRFFRRHGSLDKDDQLLSFYYKSILPPPNDDCVNAVPLTLSDTGYVMTSGSLLAATSSDPNFSNRIHVWYSFIPQSNYVSLKSAYYDTNAPGFELLDACDATFSTNFAGVKKVIPGKQYFVRVYTSPEYMHSNGKFELGVMEHPAPVNETCGEAISLPPSSGEPVFTSFDLRNAGSENSNCGAVAYDIWYKFKAESNSSTIKFQQEPNMGAAYTIFSSCDLSSNIYCRKNDTTFTFQTIQGQDYFISVHLFYGEFYNKKPGKIAVLANPEVNNLTCQTADEVVSQKSSCVKISVNFGNVPLIAGSAKEVWYKFIPSDSTQLIEIQRNNTDTDFYLYKGCGTAGLSLISHNYTDLYGFSMRADELDVNAVYFFRIRTKGTVEGNLQKMSFCIHGPDAVNDECFNAMELNPDCSYQGNIDLFKASRSADKSCTTGKFNSDIWFKFTTSGFPDDIYILQLDYNSHMQTNIRFEDYKLEISDSCNAISPSCIKTGNLIYGSNYRSESVEFVINNLHSLTTYYLRLIQPDLGSASYKAATEFQVKFFKSPGYEDFYNYNAFGSFSDDDCYRFNRCNASSRSVTDTVNNLNTYVNGYYDQWISFKAKTSQVRFVMDNSFFYELFPYNINPDNINGQALNGYNSVNYNDSVVYYHAVLDSNTYYKLRMVSRSKYMPYGYYDNQLCIQYLLQNELNNSCMNPVVLNEGDNITTLPLHKSSAAELSCEGGTTNSSGWFSFSSSSEKKILEFFDLPDGAEVALYYSCDSILECFSDLSGNTERTLALEPGHLYISNVLFTNADIKSEVKIRLKDVVVTSGSNFKSSNMVVYPNPAMDFLTIDGYADGISVVVQNMSGAEVLRSEIKSGKISIENLKPGFYILNVGDQKFKILKMNNVKGSAD